MNRKEPLFKGFKEEKLLTKCERFRQKEKRARFYDLAMEVVDEYPLQAAIIILSTWNVQPFVLVRNNPRNLIKLRKVIDETKHKFGKVKNKNLQTVNFKNIGTEIKDIYRKFKNIKGVKYTGASKVMHLLCPNLIVMWDTHIRAQYKKGESPSDFLAFQKLMQKLSKDIKWNNPNKTLAKAIDEYNYVTITLPKSKRRRSK